MADTVFNIAKGRTIGFYENVEGNSPANSAFIVVLLQVAQSDAILKDYDDLGTLLAAANTEATFTNYARKVLTDAELAAFPAPNDTSDAYEITFPDIVYTAAGGALNNTMAKLVICYDADTTTGTDANIVPVGAWDYTGTTDGSDITIQFPAAAYSAG